MIDFETVYKKIGYSFKDKELLTRALSHSSYTNEKNLGKLSCNERLEFLGDAVLEVTISEMIYNFYEKMPEGEMTKLRASIVCEESLSSVARHIELGEHLLLGKGEQASGGRNRNSILADMVEAILGAVFLDGGVEEARKLVQNMLFEMVERGTEVKGTDFKTTLQEVVQRRGKASLKYEVYNEKGPEHDKTFMVSVSFDDEIIGKGAGKSKKEAEQNAAKEGLTHMKVKSLIK